MSNTLKKLKKLGDRGLVVATAGASGEPAYYFVLESEWRAWRIGSVPEKIEALASAGASVGQAPATKGAFIDFPKLKVKQATPDELKAVAVEASNAGKPLDSAKLVPADLDGIVIHLQDKEFYSVSKSDWERNPLTDGSEGDAGTLVDRGAIAANVPDDSIPIGTYCVLVNLALMNKT